MKSRPAQEAPADAATLSEPRTTVDELVDQEGLRRVTTLRSLGGISHRQDDLVACEEPLEIRIGGVSVAVVMRTPGGEHADQELVRGFLISERIIECPTTILSLRHCSTAPSPEADGNVVDVRLEATLEATLDLDRLRRNLFASSSCGICGKATIANVMQSGSAVDDTTEVTESLITGLPARLREHQQLFDWSGGLHAAALFTAAGHLVVVREDVGRHNAVDKVIGFAAGCISEASDPEKFALSGHILCVSGRVSFEIVQKALAARIPIVVAVSAPTSLAVQLAETARVTLVAFARGRSMNIYSEPQRIVTESSATSSANPTEPAIAIRRQAADV